MASTAAYCSCFMDRMGEAQFDLARFFGMDTPKQTAAKSFNPTSSSPIRALVLTRYTAWRSSTPDTRNGVRFDPTTQYRSMARTSREMPTPALVYRVLVRR